MARCLHLLPPAPLCLRAVLGTSRGMPPPPPTSRTSDAVQNVQNILWHATGAHPTEQNWTSSPLLAPTCSHVGLHISWLGSPDGADGGVVGSAGGAVGTGTAGPGADDGAAGVLAGVWTMKTTWGMGVELGDCAAGTGAGFDLDKVVASGLTSGFAVIADMQPPSSSAGQFEGRPAVLLYPSGDWMSPTFLHLRAGGAKALQAPSTPPAPPARSSGEPPLLPECKQKSHWRASSKEMEVKKCEKMRTNGCLLTTSRIQRGQKNTEVGAQRQQKKGPVVISSRGSNVLSVITHDNCREGRQEEERERESGRSKYLAHLCRGLRHSARALHVIGASFGSQSEYLSWAVVPNTLWLPTTLLQIKVVFISALLPLREGGVGGGIGGAGGGVIP
ncbi:hypothetical protein FB451DRAFT_1372045 [Mycena latifolia]|nr:hypothetical protein FB451DRAFT_1372045 [Mycena latifolia]